MKKTTTSSVLWPEMKPGHSQGKFMFIKIYMYSGYTVVRAYKLLQSIKGIIDDWKVTKTFNKLFSGYKQNTKIYHTYIHRFKPIQSS